MLVWGDSSIGHCHALGQNRQEIVSPFQIPDLQASQNVKVLAIGEYKCCVLCKDGSVCVFGNESMNASKVTAFEALNIVDVFAGGGHMFALTEDGRAYGWGGNSFGQLGWSDNSNGAIVSVPKNVRLPKKVVQISCGQQHSLALLQDGSMYAMGDNSYGQLGSGNNTKSSQPIEISSLRGLPIAQVIAGGWHSFCITVSGRVFCWGCNDSGQLGLGDRANRKSPCLLRMLRSHTVKFISAGDFHTAVLTQDGGVFTFGSSSKGQLGHGAISEFEVNPRKVCELMGSVVTQVACGKLHTIAFVPGSRNIFACGSGEQGQLGQGQTIDCLKVPTIVNGPWQSNSRPLYNIKQISAKGNQCCAVLCSESESALDFRDNQSHRQILSVNSNLCDRMLNIADSSHVPADLVMQLECIMGSQSCINASFLAPDHHKTSNKYPGLSLMNARLLFSKIMNCANKRLLQKMEYVINASLLPSLMPNPPDIEALRLYISLPELKMFHDPDLHDSLVFPFVEKLLSLADNPSKILDQWYSSLDPDFFVTPIEMCQNCIIKTVQRGLPPNIVKRKVTDLLKFMSKLNDVNNSCNPPVIDFCKFYIPELNELIPLESDYQQWVSTTNQDFSFCKYPFVYNSKAKTILLQTDAKFQMGHAFLNVRRQNFAAFLGLEQDFDSPIIEVEIRRERLVEDAIRNIGNISNLKRPFMVKFVGEDGQDAGGVRKEFFMLTLREVLNPKYGMFQHYKDSDLLWFTDYEIETDEMYHLIGTLCGLAVYNSTIIDINFPLALYKKLLGKKPTLSDLKELDPLVGNSMQQMMEFVEEDGDTVEDMFGLDFVITREMFGEVREVELIENGKNTPVTSENRNRFIQEYLDYVFNKSIKSQFECFCKGFLRVCGGDVINLFRPEELKEMVVGNQNYNWEELEKKTVYKGVYFRNHPVINWFWEVFHALPEDEKREFVRFLTGSNKIPINGLEFTIQPLPYGDDYLPVAHTCFNVLDLPLYSSKERLESKLKVAIHSQGFYLA